MPSFTHTFEIQAGTATIEGRVVVNGDDEVIFDTQPTEGMPEMSLAIIQNMMHCARLINKEMGTLVKVELHKI